MFSKGLLPGVFPEWEEKQQPQRISQKLPISWRALPKPSYHQARASWCLSGDSVQTVLELFLQVSSQREEIKQHPFPAWQDLFRTSLSDRVEVYIVFSIKQLNIYVLQEPTLPITAGCSENWFLLLKNKFVNKEKVSIDIWRWQIERQVPSRSSNILIFWCWVKLSV